MCIQVLVLRTCQFQVPNWPYECPFCFSCSKTSCSRLQGNDLYLQHYGTHSLFSLCRSSKRIVTSVCFPISKSLKIWLRLLLPSPLSGIRTSQKMRNTVMTVWRWLLVVQRYPFVINSLPVLNKHGPWFVKKFVGNVPTIIGHKLPQKTFTGEGYIEQMIDVTADKFIAKVRLRMWSEWIVCRDVLEAGEKGRHWFGSGDWMQGSELVAWETFGCLENL